MSLLSMASSGRLKISHVQQAMLDTTLGKHEFGRPDYYQYSLQNTALKYMAKKRYVHRDVSAGNILMCDGRAKLADLEFAKEYGSGQTSYVRTVSPLLLTNNHYLILFPQGTYSFMSGEVARGKYTYRPLHKVFLHNPVHDLESLWWVGVWCLMWHYPVSGRQLVDPAKKKHTDRMKEHGIKLFPSYHSPGNDRRIDEIHHPTKYSTRSPSQYPNEIKAMLSRMDLFRQCVSWGHKRTQDDLPRNEASYFSDDLSINDPAESVESLVLDKDALPIFDMITCKLETPFTFKKGGQLVQPHDYLLWPLDAMEKYETWLKTQVRPRGQGTQTWSCQLERRWRRLFRDLGSLEFFHW